MRNVVSPEMLSPGEAAVILGVNAAYVTILARQGKLPCVRTIGGHRRFSREDVNRLAESRVTKAGGDT